LKDDFISKASFSGKSVLITGSSSGIGLSCALYFAQIGYKVFAGVRKKKDKDKLVSYKNPNLIPVFPLDLKNQYDISGACDFVSEKIKNLGQKGLYAIINNAGGGFISPVELLDPAKLREEFETRVIGPVVLLQKFLPVLREGNGRIVWILPDAGKTPPFLSSLYMCTAALDCLANTLNSELYRWKIPAIKIICSGIKTGARVKAMKEYEESSKLWPPDIAGFYSKDLDKLTQWQNRAGIKRLPPEEAAKIILKALTDKKPEKSYSAGVDKQ
jgi:NAD(P)-dependent dehydrogenase (short-subunit alcohol dehydrogenase family)